MDNALAEIYPSRSCLVLSYTQAAGLLKIVKADGLVQSFPVGRDLQSRHLLINLAI